ncbi:hypothetical protein JW859_01565 [bacterium]|nr:hypothetical protein [bacterium]
MNIFVLHTDPVRAARYHCDRHVVKMTLETAQLLSTALAVENPAQAAQLQATGLIYKPTHQNHPCSRWAAESLANFRWLARLGLALADEYSYRYSGRVHKSSAVIELCALIAGVGRGEEFRTTIARRNGKANGQLHVNGNQSNAKRDKAHGRVAQPQPSLILDPSGLVEFAFTRWSARDALTRFAQAMPELYRREDAVAAYRNYYTRDKLAICQWTRRKRPRWLNVD